MLDHFHDFSSLSLLLLIRLANLENPLPKAIREPCGLRNARDEDAGT
jgi:hypothetical protein